MLIFHVTKADWWDRKRAEIWGQVISIQWNRWYHTFGLTEYLFVPSAQHLHELLPTMNKIKPSISLPTILKFQSRKEQVSCQFLTTPLFMIEDQSYLSSTKLPKNE